MKLHKLYFSPTGGTEKIADCLGQAFPCESDCIDLCDASADFSQFRFTENDICIVAIPAFGGRVPEIALTRLGKMEGGNARTIPVVVYGNRAYEDALLELKNNLDMNGFACIAAVAAIAEHSILHQFATGRPDMQDQAELRAFGKQIWQTVQTGCLSSNLAVPGNQPYREYTGIPLKPKAGNACNQCGLCAKKCPVGAISADNPSNTDTAKCISCMRCIAVCPQHARTLNKAVLLIISQKIKKACNSKKQNELFL